MVFLDCRQYSCKYLERGYVDHLDETAIYLSLYEHLCSFGIQNKEDRSDSSSLMSKPNEDRTDLALVNDDLFFKKGRRGICRVNRCVFDAELFYQAIKVVFLHTNTMFLRPYRLGN